MYTINGQWTHKWPQLMDSWKGLMDNEHTNDHS